MHDLDAAGAVVVGAAGPQRAALHATRWVGGVPQPLDPVGTTSVAEFSSADGTVAMGTAVRDDGAVVLVRWGPDGTAEVLGPPEGMSLTGLHALSADGSTAVGSVADGLGDPQFRDWAPFVWSARDGFTILPEAEPQAEYDRSRAVDVSDDGRVVLGVFEQSVRGPGSPRDLAFAWSRNSGLVLVNDVAQAYGIADPDYFDASTISGDGRWMLTTGQHLTRCEGAGPCPDTNSIVLWLDACPAGFPAGDPVAFGGEDSGVPNYDWGDGCTFLDAVWAEAPFGDHGTFVRAVRSRTAQWREDGLLTRQESGAILAAAARSDIGRPGGPSPEIGGPR